MRQVAGRRVNEDGVAGKGGSFAGSQNSLNRCSQPHGKHSIQKG